MVRETARARAPLSRSSGPREHRGTVMGDCSQSHLRRIPTGWQNNRVRAVTQEGKRQGQRFGFYAEESPAGIRPAWASQDHGQGSACLIATKLPSLCGCWAFPFWPHLW